MNAYTRMVLFVATFASVTGRDDRCLKLVTVRSSTQLW